MCKFLSFLLPVFVGICLLPAIAVSEPALQSATPTPLVPVAVSYFPVFPYDAGNDVSPNFVPVLASAPLEADHKGITHAIIIIHDINRDPQHDMAIVKSLAGAENSRTIIMEPQFIIPSDLTLYADRLPEKGRMFSRWSADGWVYGDDSLVDPPQHAVSSFTVVDLMLLFLAEHKNFPDLEHITITGLGLGGNFVQRYAAFSRASDLLEAQHLTPRYLVLDPSSYLYLTATRFKGEKQGFGTPDAKDCPGYNSWPYGLDKLNAYTRRIGVNAAKLHYADRKITYIVSDAAVPYSGTLDRSCSAALEGADNSNRNRIYNLYLKNIYSDQMDPAQIFITVPKVGYDLAALLGSRCGFAVLLGDGQCQDPDALNVGNPQ